MLLIGVDHRLIDLSFTTVIGQKRGKALLDLFLLLFNHLSLFRIFLRESRRRRRWIELLCWRCRRCGIVAILGLDHGLQWYKGSCTGGGAPIEAKILRPLGTPLPRVG